jgi:selenocysteine lyase/cysteine desulfurase
MLRGLLDDLPGVTTHDLGQVRCAIVTAQVRGIPAVQVAAFLDTAGVNVTTTVPEHTQFDTADRAIHPLVRLSPHYYNTDDELERTAKLVAELTRHA